MARVRNGTSALRRTAAEIKGYRLLMRVIPIALGCIASLTALVYIISILYSKYGSFTVTVNKFHNLEYALSLSETADFQSGTSRLNCKASKEITCIDGNSLNNIDLGAIDGEDGGANYLCYTFYCKNAGTKTLNYEYSITIANMTLDIERAVRVKLIANRNGTNGYSEIYARASGVDANGNAVPEPDTLAFRDKYTVCTEESENFAPGDVSKYTVVIWLEGNDPDCVDAIIGGEFKVDMKFSVVGIDAQEND